MQRFTNSVVMMLICILCMVPAIGYGQGDFTFFGSNEADPGVISTHAGKVTFAQNLSNIEFGVRFDTHNYFQSTLLESPGLSAYVARVPEIFFRLSEVQANEIRDFNLKIAPKSDYRGVITFTFFCRFQNTRQYLFSKVYSVSVGQLPAPAMTVPVANENIACSPVFRGVANLTYPQDIQYQIEVTGPTNKTITLPAQPSNNTFTYYTPLEDGFQPGNYTWRTRALDSRGKPGLWSGIYNNVVYGGLDMAGTASQSFLNSMRAAGWSSFFAAAWGGRNIWTPAATNLIRANNAGFKVAAYAFLNFDNSSTIAGAPANQTGQWQVDQGLKAIGFVGNKSSLPYDLKYFMIDIENAYQGTMAPDDRVQRIAEAVQHVRNLGFWPMIYTRNEGSNQWWNLYTNSSDEFREMPLWDSKPEVGTAIYKDHLTLSNGSPWVPYGGWEVRGGKQYYLDVTVLGHRVDFSVWDPEVWNVNSPDPGAINVYPANVSIVRTATNTYKVTVTLANNGTVEAYGVRLGNATLGAQSLTGRQTLGLIAPDGSRAGVYEFPFSAGNPGTSVQLSFTVWTGNGSQTHTGFVNLP
ncbi:MAG: hypothetical protein KF824_06125 [Fimbriimonadaceae bacterium]|nr:MAG: hypothetical protein KF824_06125 [Fimbriimonadaceae bacterium]